MAARNTYSEINGDFFAWSEVGYLAKLRHKPGAEDTCTRDWSLMFCLLFC